ncbi:2-dehydropantoate 2-reductase N-terminal domain-containing protein [Streptomyces sp. DSM 44915]|uniref:2-dehydropantoate 2-reductase N-terminal domain-containing protein n=1 Tax=Streptomyces chisholmiae TaxID=3075540 RepID=A0ABU2JNR1_9ACTN|nr:2-dehydropantoate 2-reductase N-terminal domain-containing protein [Streptomyces sp. DSM 44915]MDT0266635.1 2-dehydropantoate 2-reductase N-terminal domain-containing protein [Streptomyces sp. DSM 44915]
MTRYVVIGAGAVGGALAADLHLAGVPVLLVARGATLAAVRERGLLRITPAGRRAVRLPVVAGPEEAALTTDDVLVLAVKTQDARATLADWAWRPVTEDGRPAGTAARLPLLTLQNGLDAEREAARFFRTVLGGTVLVPARHLVPGEVLTGAAPRTGQLFVGGLPHPAPPGPPAPAAEAFVTAATAAGWLAQTVPQIARWKAWKLRHNVTNAVEVLAGEPAELAALGRRAAAEAGAALAAAGYTPADPATERTFDPAEVAVVPGAGYQPGQQSTWQSFARGASSEVDFLNGEIVLLGRLHGVPTPVNEALQHLLGASALAGEPPGTRTVAELAALVKLFTPNGADHPTAPDRPRPTTTGSTPS